MFGTEIFYKRPIEQRGEHVHSKHQWGSSLALSEKDDWEFWRIGVIICECDIKITEIPSTLFVFIHQTFACVCICVPVCARVCVWMCLCVSICLCSLSEISMVTSKKFVHGRWQANPFIRHIWIYIISFKCRNTAW